MGRHDHFARGTLRSSWPIPWGGKRLLVVTGTCMVRRARLALRSDGRFAGLLCLPSATQSAEWRKLSPRAGPTNSDTIHSKEGRMHKEWGKVLEADTHSCFLLHHDDRFGVLRLGVRKLCLNFSVLTFRSPMRTRSRIRSFSLSSPPSSFWALLWD